MNLNFTIGLISTFFLSLPVLLMAGQRLPRQKSFLALFIYYTSAVIYNLLTLKIIHANPQVVSYWGMANNLLDAPLMLYFYLYFSPSRKFYNNTKLIIVSLIVFELTVVAIKGLNNSAISIFMAPGILLVLLYSMRMFGKYTKLSFRHSKAAGKALIAAALVFAYGCYALLYAMYYIFKIQVENGVTNPAAVADTFLVYYISTIFSSATITIGIYYESSRVHKIREMKQTRKELKIIYMNSPKMAPPFRAAMLDFDKEHWN